VPGQVLDAETIAFLEALDTPEIHGYDPERGLRVFTNDAVAAAAGDSEPADGGRSHARAPARIVREALGLREDLPTEVAAVERMATSDPAGAA
jgi:hypothetical protein